MDQDVESFGHVLRAIMTPEDRVLREYPKIDPLPVGELNLDMNLKDAHYELIYIFGHVEEEARRLYN